MILNQSKKNAYIKKIGTFQLNKITKVIRRNKKEEIIHFSFVKEKKKTRKEIKTSYNIKRETKPV